MRGRVEAIQNYQRQSATHSFHSECRPPAAAPPSVGLLYVGAFFVVFRPQLVGPITCTQPPPIVRMTSVERSRHLSWSDIIGWGLALIPYRDIVYCLDDRNDILRKAKERGFAEQPGWPDCPVLQNDDLDLRWFGKSHHPGFKGQFLVTMPGQDIDQLLSDHPLLRLLRT